MTQGNLKTRSRKTAAVFFSGVAVAALFVTGHRSFAGPFPNRTMELSAAYGQDEPSKDESFSVHPSALPVNIRIIRDVSYGGDEKQRFDVYIPAEAHAAPVIFLVHGGAWLTGDKAAQAVVQNKVSRWVPKGFIVVSTNYRLLPRTAPVEQAKDVARALAAAQDKAASWGGDRTKFILVGHSAGAHLAALLATAPSVYSGIPVAPWLGTVSLDSAVLDVAQKMETRHPPFYDRAFGENRAYWESASPYYRVAGPGKPMLLVCSTRRDDSCPQAKRFAAKASSLGMRATVMEEDLSHKDINGRLGEDQGYTEAVESFLAGLDGSIAALLAQYAPGGR